MKKVVISFTEQGTKWNKKITDLWNRSCKTTTGYSFYKFKEEGLYSFERLQDVVEEAFQNADGILFIGSTGIAVRAIAPYLKGKAVDPAVLVMDEKAEHVISLLSGHLGGANEWCLETSEITGAMPVITTATDLNDKFAVDNFSKENHLRILDISKIKEISGEILRGNRIGFRSDFQVEGQLPKELFWGMGDLKKQIVISYEEAGWFPLVPMDLIVGMGCKKGIRQENLYKFLTDIFNEKGWSLNRIRRISSIDKKKQEEGLIKLGKALRVPFVTYSEKQLGALEGEFSGSGFVKETVGVDNVCERSAAYGETEGKFLLRKQAMEGMTIAVFQVPVKISFERERY